MMSADVAVSGHTVPECQSLGVGQPGQQHPLLPVQHRVVAEGQLRQGQVRSRPGHQEIGKLRVKTGVSPNTQLRFERLS